MKSKAWWTAREVAVRHRIVYDERWLSSEAAAELADKLKRAFEQVAVGKTNASIAPEIAKGHLIRGNQIIREVIEVLGGGG